MPRSARLDSPGTLHHVIIRGIERRSIVNDNRDREDFVSRLGRLAMEARGQASVIRYWLFACGVLNGPGRPEDFRAWKDLQQAICTCRDSNLFSSYLSWKKLLQLCTGGAWRWIS